MAISYKHKIYTTLGTPVTIESEFSPVYTTTSAGVPAKDYTVKGKTIVWNQLINKANFPSSNTISGITFTTNTTDGTITINGTKIASNSIHFNFNSVTLTVGHKYLYGTSMVGSNLYKLQLVDHSADESYSAWVDTIFECEQGTSFNAYVDIYTTNAISNVIFKPQLFDLTLMFGPGNEPATAMEFRTMFQNSPYSYNAGELKSIEPTGIEVIGLNQLKLTGRTEVSDDRDPSSIFYDVDKDVVYKGFAANGYLQSGRITEYSISDSSVSLNGTTIFYGIGFPMKASPSTTYYIYMTGSGKYVRISYVSPEKKIIGFTDTENPIEQFTTPANCAYIIVIFLANPTDTEIKFENICVSTLQTTEYKPYNKRVQTIDTINYFPDGMRSAGSVYDEVNFLSQKAIKRIGSVDMGALNWNSNTGQYPSNSFYSSAITDAKGNTTNVISNRKFNIIYVNSGGNIIAATSSDEQYDSSAAFKAAMSGVMLYYELATPVETTITPSLQPLSTFKGFTSFSAPNSLTQNGPLSVTYYAEGGENPEEGWLTSYKRKLYMGKNIEWNQLFDKNATPNRNSTAITYSVDGDVNTLTTTSVITISLFNFLCPTVSGHKYLVCARSLEWTSPNHSNLFIGKESHPDMASYAILTSSDLSKFFTATGDTCYIKSYISYSAGDYVFKMKGLQLFDLTQMFGAGNEPSTPEEFWSYFPNKVYPYNTGETQPLFKISRKSVWGVNKGDLITIDSKSYRVLNINGNIAEVLAMYNPSTVNQSFGTTQIYENSSADTYCNETFYNSLSSVLKNAIVEKTIVQDSWFRGSHGSAIKIYNAVSTVADYTMSLMNPTFGTSLARKCYVLSIQDIIDYLEVTTEMTFETTTLNTENIWKLFWNQTTTPGTGGFYYPWTRSASVNDSATVFDINSNNGRLDYDSSQNPYIIRPAFQVDLSKIVWERTT